MSSPNASDAIIGSSHDFSTKPGQNPFKNLRQCDCSTFIRIIATIVQGFFMLYDDSRPKFITDKSPTLWLSHKVLILILQKNDKKHRHTNEDITVLFYYPRKVVN